MRIHILLNFLILFRAFSCELETTDSDQCGGTFTGFQYQIQSPNYPKNYPPDRDCVYDLKASEFAKCDQEFHLQFLDFQLEASEGCEKDYVRVGPGSIYCGNSIGIRKYPGHNKSLKLIFHSDKNTTAKGFRILVTTLPCVEDTTASKIQEIPHPSASDPRVKFEAEDEARGDQPPSLIRGEISGPKNPSENFELPEFERHDFGEKNCGHSHSVTPYLYLPPAEIKRPVKISDANTATDLIQPPFSEAVIQSKLSQFYQPSNRWFTYGTPNSQAPSIPGGNFDPFGNSNNNNGDSGVSYNPVSPNCKNNYYPNNDNNNWNPSSNTGDNFSPGSYHPTTNFGGGNGYPEIVINGNDYPSNNFYGTDDATYYNTGLSECCSTRYSSDNFLITSPGFPGLIYSSGSYECRYTIERSSQNICQLRMYLKFFNFGSEDQFCAYGSVEIDGQRLCGCKTGANVTSSFDNIGTKTITVKYLGYPRTKFSGFVIEVTQVSCSTNYPRFRENLEQENPEVVGSFHRNNKRSTSEVTSSLAREKRDLGYFYDRPNAPSTASQNLQFLNTCRLLKFLNWVKAAKQVYLRNAQCYRGAGSNGVSSSISVIPIFPETGNSAIINFPSSSNCETINLIEGVIASPYYPNSYSNNLNQCYRFYKAPGFCQLELAILDFDLENSTICRKDYVSFSGHKRRYCGRSLAGSRTIFDMTRSSFADLYFVTDSSVTGRGFRAGFTQISC